MSTCATFSKLLVDLLSEPIPLVKKNFVILLVDDDAEDLEIFSYAVSDLGLNLKIVEALSGEDALEKLHSATAENLPDVIFMDLNMPLMNGHECLQQIKSNPALQHIPVYMHSTSARRVDMDLCLGAGATDFITKPNTQAELRNVVTRILEKLN